MPTLSGSVLVKICMITSTYKLSESDVNVPFLVESVRRLVRSGASVHVFAPSYEGCKSHEVDGVPVHRFRYFLGVTDRPRSRN
jgi:hypothetical protein